MIVHMKKLLIFTTTALLFSCSSTDSWKPTNRQVAAVAMEQLMVESPENLNELIEEKLSSLHNYYVIGHRNLLEFDESIKNLSTEEIYQSEAYLKLLAVRTQAEEIEHELLELDKNLSQTKSTQKRKLVREQLAKFAGKSPMSALSMQNLAFSFGLPQGVSKASINIKKELSKELEKLEQYKEFIIYEKNIEHIAHTLDTKNVKSKRFEPSTTRTGNITGNEFPAKVWSLTFDDGPGRKTTQSILADLKKRKMKASFFQLTQKAQENQSVAKELRAAGMEIALHSYSHKQLTKVNNTVLEKEITTALKDLKKIHDNIDIHFFRLPYGAGVNTTHIRQKIAENKLIHVFWNVDTLDWMAQPTADIVKRTVELMKKTKNDAGVILFHDIHQRTADASPQIMDYLQKDGRRVCTLKTIVDDINAGAAKVCSK